MCVRVHVSLTLVWKGSAHLHQADILGHRQQVHRSNSKTNSPTSKTQTPNPTSKCNPIWSVRAFGQFELLVSSSFWSVRSFDSKSLKIEVGRRGGVWVASHKIVQMDAGACVCVCARGGWWCACVRVRARCGVRACARGGVRACARGGVRACARGGVRACVRVMGGLVMCVSPLGP